MSPRPRKKDRLPPYCEIRSGGVWMRDYEDGKLGKRHWLCQDGTPNSEVWRLWEDRRSGVETRSLQWLIERFLNSDKFQERARSTQDDYRKDLKRIGEFPMADGKPFGTAPIAAITTKVLQKWMDARGLQAKVRANREIAALSAAFTWGVQRLDGIDTNPCKGVDRFKEKARDRYVTDLEYSHVYQLAGDRVFYLQPMMEIAVICRAREGEIFALRGDQHVGHGKLELRRSKGSKTQIIDGGDRLERAIRAAWNGRARFPNAYIFADDHGAPIKLGAVRNAWQRLMKIATATGLKERFTIHDLKAKGVSDFDGDKFKASGHKTPRMAAVYDRKIEVVKGTN
ncbi:MAG: hypothetical protein H6981_07070 [Gammaproteobacteria bacterium]|nr:hypothetical protein [Gammaproteobacteria bacterium]